MSTNDEFQRLILELFRELKEDNAMHQSKMENAISGLRSVMKEENEKLRSEMKKGFGDVQKELERVERRLERVEDDVRADRDKLQEVYESRNRVSVKFTQSWATASFFVALISSTIVLAVAKAF